MGDTFSRLVVHIVFSTKNRAPLITAERREGLYRYIGGIIRAGKGSLLEIGGMPDHVHLLARFKPDPSVAVMVREIKARSSRWMKEFAGTAQFAWQTGYGVFSVSESQIPVVRRYIERQEEHHARWTFEHELSLLVAKHRIDSAESRPSTP